MFICIPFQQVHRPLGRRLGVVPPQPLVVVECAEMHADGWRGRRGMGYRRREKNAEQHKNDGIRKGRLHFVSRGTRPERARKDQKITESDGAVLIQIVSRIVSRIALT